MFQSAAKRSIALHAIKPIHSRTALLQFPPFKIPSFMFVLRVITAKCLNLKGGNWKRASRTNQPTKIEMKTVEKNRKKIY